MKDHVRYGLLTTIVWNVLFFAAFAYKTTSTDYSLAADITEEGYVLLLFPIAWSIMYYYVGQAIRKEYVGQKNYFRELAPDVPVERYNKAFKQYYTAKYAKMLGRVAILGVPAYLVYPLRGEISYYAIGGFMVAAAICYGVYFLNRQHEIADKLK